MKRRAILAILLGVLLTGASTIAEARNAYFAGFSAKYPAAASLGCSVCHNPNLTRNVFGKTFKRNHTVNTTVSQALTRSEPVDSDLDGFTNLTEIKAKSYPGDSTSVPLRLLFFDNFSNAASSNIPDWSLVSGTWSGNGRLIKAMGLTSVNLILADTGAPALAAFGKGFVSSKVRLFRVAGTTANAFLVFSLRSAGRYRYVRVTENEIAIGQMGTMGGVTAGDKAAATAPIQTKSHNIKVKFAGKGKVDVLLDGDKTPIVSYQFGKVVKGGVGLLTSSGKAGFDGYTVSK